MVRDNTYLIGNQFAKGSKPNRTSFKKGIVPWNTGKKGIHLSPISEFKKGQRPVNYLPVGTITKRKTKAGTIRQFIKIADPNKWQQLANYQWERKYHKLLKGDVVHHLNGNPVDDTIDNLLALPRQDHPKYHNHRRVYPISKELKWAYIKRYL